MKKFKLILVLAALALSLSLSSGWAKIPAAEFEKYTVQGECDEVPPGTEDGFE